MLTRRSDGMVEALCGRCLVSSPIASGAAELEALGWELRHDGQTWCLACSRDARTPKGRPNTRGVVGWRRR